MKIKLPQPDTTGKISVEQAIFKRRTLRSFRNKEISLVELSQLLWSCQGFTSPDGLRTAPSAGALYPLEIFIVTKNVSNLEKGIYKYIPSLHSIELVQKGEFEFKLADASLKQEQVSDAVVNIIITVIYKRLSWKYGERSVRYALIEVGHAAQNVMLQAECLNLGVCPIGAFHDKQVKEIIGIKESN